MGLDITGLGSVFDFGSKIIDKIWPNKDEADRAKIALIQLQQQGEFKELEVALELAKGQMAINQEEAKSGSLFVSGARPAVMWVCVTAYAFNYLFMPLANWLVKFYDINAPSIVALDSSELTTLLFGMLGLGAMRTVEKIRGVVSK